MTKHDRVVTLWCQGAELGCGEVVLALFVRWRGLFGLYAQSLLQLLHSQLVSLDDLACVDLVGGFGSELV